MTEYLNIDNFISKKADLYNFVNPFFDEKYRQSHNFYYILFNLSKYKNYFDNLFLNVDPKVKLDINQRIAILTQNKNILVIAGAGSGKTTTIAAKIRFMVEILNVNPIDICILAYTNEAVISLKKTIVEGFKINTEILTFHKFALKLIDNHKKIIENYNFIELFNNYNSKTRVLILIYLYFFYDINILDIYNKTTKLNKSLLDYFKDCCTFYYEEKQTKRTIRAFLFRKLYSFFEKSFMPSLYNDITFDQIIKEAQLSNNYKKKFKYLIIDEYQDISNLRLKLITKYLKMTNSSLFAVGDDWQTIYSFAASNINNILSFDLFNDYKRLKILRTYRNSQELIDIAGTFIMRNNKQIKKQLISNKHLIEPIVMVVYKNDKTEKIGNILEQIKQPGIKIAFLLRYKKDLDEIVDNKLFSLKDNHLFYKNDLEIFYYTIHTSKGLGFDYVFVLNNKNAYYGFPTKKRDKSIFKNENVIMEERRLFYVSLTRTKNKVFLLYPFKHKSQFLKELKKILKKIKYLI